ncbi:MULTISPECIES: hypothetical protein [Bacillus cereus group]|uniref:Uncharacterized protein n=2 Tax=root TaxID=1 RepID=A0A1B1P7C5_9CAUD|nr:MULTISPECIES: hypothetical protein [Bacillus cereus group]YP_009830692.1 hypothetical protein HWA95_gp38 [Bacillus phage vB_BtS_BMBtp14]ANT39998.1 hypothetical protein BMBtpLA2_38 [Bacillus phage vB_BtS_BMBtp14]MEB9673590.1 hypothetical protein [Bacillus anthracis]OTX09765.1 hypothetical protein BK705_04060 [Bacillus thuringiensis serovar monterrey]OTX56322.1 hypothetical protein BK724_00195 [Bacillus thuringiensis serovar sooncheon]
MNTVTVNIHATIIKGALKGVSGKVVGFDSEMDMVSIEVDEDTFIETKSGNVKQN